MTGKIITGLVKGNFAQVGERVKTTEAKIEVSYFDGYGVGFCGYPSVVRIYI